MHPASRPHNHAVPWLISTRAFHCYPVHFLVPSVALLGVRSESLDRIVKFGWEGGLAPEQPQRFERDRPRLDGRCQSSSRHDSSSCSVTAFSRSRN